MPLTFHSLKIIKKIRETASAVSLLFEVPEALRDSYTFRSGQYITLEVEISGKKHRRSYSISAAPHEGILKTTVKKVESGYVSVYLVDQIKVDDAMMVSTPEGQFHMEWQDHLHRKHYFLTAGSGITPVISMIKDGLENEPKSAFILLYGNRDTDSIIFNEELEELHRRYDGQFFVHHTLSHPEGKRKGFIPRIKKKSKRALWTGDRGRISGEKLQRLFMEHPPEENQSFYYLCGPGDMIQDLEQWLRSQGLAQGNILKEYFTAANEASIERSKHAQAKLTALNLLDEPVELIVEPGSTILEALQDNDLDAPYSCTNGVCSSCIAKLIKGQVEMDNCLALDDDEIESGYILTCQSYPVSGELEIDYED